MPQTAQKRPRQLRPSIGGLDITRGCSIFCVKHGKRHDTTPDRERVGVTTNLNDTIRQLGEENLRKQENALLGKTLIETLTAQEAAAHAHKKAGFTAHIAAAKSSHAAATATRGKRRTPMPANQPRITAWMHPPAGKRAREKDDAGGHDLAETEPLNDWLQQKHNGRRVTKRWSEKE